MQRRICTIEEFCIIIKAFLGCLIIILEQYQSLRKQILLAASILITCDTVQTYDPYGGLFLVVGQ